MVPTTSFIIKPTDAQYSQIYLRNELRFNDMATHFSVKTRRLRTRDLTVCLKEEALDCTMWRNRFGGGVGPVVRQNTK